MELERKDPLEETKKLLEDRVAMIERAPDHMIRLGDELALVKTSLVAVSIAETYRHMYEGVYKVLERYRENCAQNAAYDMEHDDGYALEA